MNAYVALLRAINVGGTGKLPMTELRALCEGCGFQDVATYIQSGNVVFRSKLSAARAKAALERALTENMGKPYGVLIRSAAEFVGVPDENPFPKASPTQVLVFFFDERPAASAIANVPIPGREELALHGRELFIHFPDGMGRSKLKIPFQKTATGRNLNTVRKLAAMVQELA
jgi:uncharacterized protein (DUF1697 family)